MEKIRMPEIKPMLWVLNKIVWKTCKTKKDIDYLVSEASDMQFTRIGRFEFDGNEIYWQYYKNLKRIKGKKIRPWD